MKIFDATVLSTWMKHDWNKDTLKTTGPLLALEPGLSFSILNMVWETSLGSTQECCYLYHCALNVLAVEAISQNKLLWKIRPKLHKILVCISCQKRRGCPRDPVIYQYFTSTFLYLRMDHVCYGQSWRLNPLWVACYGDEDMVGACKDFGLEAIPCQMARQWFIELFWLLNVMRLSSMRDELLREFNAAA